MFVQTVQIKNYRLFPPTSFFEATINVPDGMNNGSGLTAFVGENGCGKTSFLEAMALPLVQYKSENVEIVDFNDITKDCEVRLISESNFTVNSTMPKGNFEAKGFSFTAKLRARANKAYMSSIVVSDQRFIPVDSTKPQEDSPDLRVNINNPFKGRRFDENDVLVLDKSRTYQTRLGNYSPTRFDRLMEDFDFQYIKNTTSIPDIHQDLNGIRDKTENNFLNQAIEKFKNISGDDLSLNLIDNWRPFKKGFLAVTKDNNQQIPLHMLGSGYEMIFCFLVSFYLSQQSGKQLICLIDEPELHLHPSLQEKFIELLLEFSKSAQVIVTTHSPLFVKQLLKNKYSRIEIICKDGNKVESVPLSKGVLPYISANEINYLAFNLPTAEYHDELYGQILEAQQKYSENEMISYLNSVGIKSIKKWNQERDGKPLGERDVPLQVFIRNKVHHPENRSMNGSNFTSQELQTSIKQMVDLIKQSNGTTS